MKCLYRLPEDHYQLMLETSGEVVCVCEDCNYYAKRIRAKRFIPLHVYDAEVFQDSLAHDTRQANELWNL